MAKKATALKDLKALRALDTAGLQKELTATEKELFVLQMKQVAGELKQSHLIASHRRQIARIKTLLTETAAA
jgi:large subunit ribosomal protein L29